MYVINKIKIQVYFYIFGNKRKSDVEICMNIGDILRICLNIFKIFLKISGKCFNCSKTIKPDIWLNEIVKGLENEFNLRTEMSINQVMSSDKSHRADMLSKVNALLFRGDIYLNIVTDWPEMSSF